MNDLGGRCHCGNLSLRLRSALGPEGLPVRLCACSFCCRHGQRWTSDPAGEVRITVADPAALVRYRFGTRTADFLVCGRCGVCVAAVDDLDPSAPRAVVSVNALDDAERFTSAPSTFHYDAESAVERRARRALRWTPVAVHLGR